MANVLVRRFFNLGTRIARNNEFLNYTPCANVLVFRINQENRYSVSHNSQWRLLNQKLKKQPRVFDIQHFSSKEDKKPTPVKNEPAKKLSLLQRFKQMYKEYWYVLVPVHLVTSAAWFGGFYYLAKSGVDIVTVLESMHISERIINPLKDSSMGYIAVAYALYKITTPIRYTVTLGGTTLSINYLRKWGYIKPVPSSERLKEMYQEKKEDFMDGFKVQSDKLKDKKEHMIGDLDKGIKQIKEMREKIKPGNIMGKVKKN